MVVNHSMKSGLCLASKIFRVIYDNAGKNFLAHVDRFAMFALGVYGGYSFLCIWLVGEM